MGRLSKDEFEWNHFVTKLSELIEKHSVVELKYIGFPDEWETILRDIQIN